MADCTFAQVGQDARARLNDVDVPAGEYATDTALQPHRERAYREMFDALVMIQSNRIDRVIYWVLPAYSQLLSPEGHIGLPDFAEPVFVEERNSITTRTITSTGSASPIQVTTSTPHNLGPNQEVTIMGVQGTTSPWGRWFVSIVSPTVFILNYSVSDGNPGTGGTVCWSNEHFTDVDAIDRIHDTDLSDKLRDYVWEEGVFKFRGATTNRQLRITYRASGNPPALVNQKLGIDNCLNFLGTRTASFVAYAKGWYDQAQILKAEALGAGGEVGAPGGFLGVFLRAQINATHREQRQRGLFRRRRSTADWALV
jgi:hypothetical protein